jgi:hypothetical protein
MAIDANIAAASAPTDIVEQAIFVILPPAK